MGVKIWPGKVSSKANQMDRELGQLKESVEREMSIMEVLNSSESSEASLKGQAWSSARTYVREIQKPLLRLTLDWIEQQQEGNARYRSAAQYLPMVACLDEDQLEDALNYWENRLRQEYNREYPRSSVIRNCRTMISEMNSKLAALRNFVRGTRGIYDRAMGLQVLLDRADTEVGKVSYDPQTKQIDFSSVDEEWLSDVRWTGVMEKLKADGLTEEELQAIRKIGESEWSSERVMELWEEIKARGISRADLERMNTMGMDLIDVLVVWDNAESEDDRIFIAGLMKGDYKAAFEADADKITGNTQLFLAGYVIQISLQDTNSEEEVQKLLNAMLSCGYDETAILDYDPKNNVNGIQYVKMLYSGIGTVQELERAALQYPEALTEEQREELLRRNKQMMALATMSASVYHIIQNKEDHGEWIRNSAELKLGGLRYDEETESYSFHLSYERLKKLLPPHDDRIYEIFRGSYDVETEILRRPSSVRGEMYLESLRDLEKAKEELKEKLMFDVTMRGTAALIGVVSPVAGAVLEGLYYLAQGEVGDGAESGTELMGALTSENVKWNGFMEGGIPSVSVEVLQSFLDYRNDMTTYLEGEKLNEWREKMSWFGQGGVYVIGEETQLVITGMYNPMILERVGIWERQGLDALMKEVYGRSLLEIKGQPIPKDDIEEFMNSLTENEKILWNGGEIYAMDFKEFETAVRDLERKYQKINKRGTSIQGMIYTEGMEEE